jgi:hypothetical protein
MPVPDGEVTPETTREVPVKIRTVAAATAVLPLALASLAVTPSDDCRLVDVAGTPEDETDDIELCRTETWFHGPDEKVGNLQSLGLASGPTFDDQPPASVEGGSGSGKFSDSLLGSDGTVTFTGTYEGNIDNLAVTLYAFNFTSAELLGNHGAIVSLVVDGDTLYQTTADWDELAIRPEGDVLKRIDFAFPRLLEDVAVDSAEPHTVEVSIAALGGTDDAIYVWDAAEAPSGLTFNVTSSELFGYTQLG